ncbi:hypothetical protein CDO52_00815 [Nocardiopsis gilva YIM 90087]|uniref:Uncharacterized protein n=1 Tax=Nocardiopsis gilva YIM 90087 TaxID=1235441 RepID=A0A223S067_9ACTN|nr:hypothetical protein [Nocardiopsis gilva]ASU81520.1 hypothetical protein CDO52_00815 [Nocardiopsis gilva YIM 90087]
MIILAVIIAVAAAYLWYGFARVAPTFVARMVAEFIEDYPTLAAKPRRVAQERREQAGFAIGIALSWPLYLTGRALTGGIADRAPLTDHELRQQLQEKERRIAERERRIAELERRNAIGEEPWSP